MKSAEREHAGVSCGASCANRFVALVAARWKAQAMIAGRRCSPGLPWQPAARPLAAPSFKPSFRDVTNLLSGRLAQPRAGVEPEEGGPPNCYPETVNVPAAASRTAIAPTRVLWDWYPWPTGTPPRMGILKCCR